MTAVIRAKGLTKRYGSILAVDNASFEVGEGRIVGLIGPNGAGKSSTLKTVLGLSRYSGKLDVLGRNPARERVRLMEETAFIADVASLPEWMKVEQLLILMRGVHPRFREEITRDFLSRTEIPYNSRIRTLSKGMKTQLHLAVVMGIDARLLVLDEPTLGLDILYRRKFYSQLLDEYFDGRRTILLTTHQIDEVEHILTDIIFMRGGRVVLDMAMDEIPKRFTQLTVNTNHLDAARALKPLHEEELLQQTRLLFLDLDRQQLEPLGELTTPRLAEIFVACISAIGGGQAIQAP